jgi:hypothetical protein
MKLECLVGNVFDWPWEVGRFDAVLITFTLLEFAEADRLYALISKQTTDGGLLVVTMPDTWPDVLGYSEADPEIIQKYRSGPVDLPKVDRFTGNSYPFRATRTEHILESLLSYDFVLIGLKQGHVADRTAVVLTLERRGKQT